MDKIRVIKLSLRCLRWGLVGLIPVIGLPFAVRALILYRRARREAGKEWNPARRQLIWGDTLAIIGCGLTALTLGAIGIAILKANQ